MGERERERWSDNNKMPYARITEQEQESIKRSPNFKGISLSCRLIATFYHTKKCQCHETIFYIHISWQMHMCEALFPYIQKLW